MDGETQEAAVVSATLVPGVPGTKYGFGLRGFPIRARSAVLFRRIDPIWARDGELFLHEPFVICQPCMKIIPPKRLSIGHPQVKFIDFMKKSAAILPLPSAVYPKQRL